MLKFRVVYTPRALTESVHWVHGHGSSNQSVHARRDAQQKAMDEQIAVLGSPNTVRTASSIS
jgi:hypothetical protein